MEIGNGEKIPARKMVIPGGWQCYKTGDNWGMDGLIYGIGLVSQIEFLYCFFGWTYINQEVRVLAEFDKTEHV